MSELSERLRDDSWRGRRFPLPPAELEVWHQTCLEADAELDRLQRRVEELEADAARWQYVKSNHVRHAGPKMDGQMSWILTGCVNRHYGFTIDVVIDAAIKEWREYREAAEQAAAEAGKECEQ